MTDLARAIFGQALLDLAHVPDGSPSSDAGSDLITLPSGKLYVDVSLPPASDSSTISRQDEPVPTIVFIHGAGESAKIYDPLIITSNLKARCKIVTYDLEGHGMSLWTSTRDGEYRIEKWARQLGEVMDHVKVERAVLVGHSIGAYIASTFATAHHDRVEGLFYINPTTSGEPNTDSAEKYPPLINALLTIGIPQLFANATPSQLGLSPKSSPLARGMVTLSWFDTSPKVIAQVYFATWGRKPDYTRLKIGQPGGIRAMVIEGEDDEVNSEQLKRDVRVGMEGAERVMLAGSGHFSQLESLEEVAELLKRFVAGWTG